MLEHIRNATGRKLFRDFLTSKYCEENLDFVLAVRRFSSLHFPFLFEGSFLGFPYFPTFLEFSDVSDVPDFPEMVSNFLLLLRIPKYSEIFQIILIHSNLFRFFRFFHFCFFAPLPHHYFTGR